MHSDRPVTLAAIAGAHGVRGEVRLKLFCEGLENLKRHCAFNGGALTLEAVRGHKDGAIARFAEIADRNAAEAARGTELTVPRSALPPLDEDEYYHVDLIGLVATSSDGEAIGEVRAIHDYGAGEIVEIERPEGAPLLVPMKVCVIENNGITVDSEFVI